MLAIFGALHLGLHAEEINYTCQLISQSKSAIQSGLLFVEYGQTESGRMEFNLPQGSVLLIKAEGYDDQRIALQDEPIYRIVLDTEQQRYTRPTPEALKCEYEVPIYVVNGRYTKHFRPDNYTDDDIVSVTRSNKWDKQAKQIFANSDIEGIDVTMRGVVYITTTEEFIFNPGNYSIVITNSEGAPVDATVYIKCGKTDNRGLMSFTSQPEKRAIAVASSYEDCHFTLPQYNGFSIQLTATPKPATPPVRGDMATFNGGGLADFTKWFMGYASEQLLQCSGAEGIRVDAMFTVGISGKIVAVNILNQNNSRAAHIVKNTIYRSPRWSPAQQDGKAVKMNFLLPIKIPARY